ncbi:MAG: hypothetical protein COW65_12150 [Cytophagales bacterium CG18_big_fil_WC_8_21_14_2_50_42_9]|nr:MAG: hypothetical protein COW65_12150 [Cytophagales bacterium CG18_big_fil_WC_8_21_14_2_50_42_9]
MRLNLKLTVFFLFFSFMLFGYVYSPETGRNSGNSIKPGALATAAGKAVKIGSLPSEINESSGLETGNKPGTYLTHNDAGNAAELFRIDSKGKLLATLPVSGAENIDWEDITKDNQGNIYIGDTGNNNNKRTHLKIYKLRQGNPAQVSIIAFEYADRKAGTADKSNYEFDCEALFWHRSKLYLVTKDRGAGITAKLYELPDQSGTHEARYISRYDVNAPVTAADISPDGKTLLLLSKGALHFFPANNSPNFFKSGMKTYDLGKVGQTEGAVFTDNKTVMITNENGDLYQYKL